MTVNQSSLIHAVAVIGILILASSSCHSGSAARSSNIARLTDEQRHRLYAAALAASDSPLDTDIFKDVCRKIGILDDVGKPNDQYTSFVGAHVEWSMKTESEEFRRQIDTKEKALAYLHHQL